MDKKIGLYKKGTKKDFRGNKAMLSYGVIQLGSTIVSAVGLLAIVLNFFLLKKELNFFNECVEEMKATDSPTADSVRFCSGS